MTRAAIYCRISLDKTGQALGVTRQEEDCRALVEHLGWELLDVYVDNDISATTGKVRPSYRRLLASIEAGEVDAVVAWHADRLYRKLADLEELITTVEKRNVIVRTVQAGEVDLSTASGRGIARILGVIATMEGEQKSERHRRSVRQSREAGAFPRARSRLYGYTHEGQIVPGEAERLRWMAAEVLNGRSMRSLVQELIERGWLTTEGGTWSQSGLRKLLLNPKVAGFATLRGEIMGPGSWDPVLDVEQWETLRALIGPRARPTPPRVALLAGMVFCDCGCRMVTGSRTTKRAGVLRRTYRCDRTPGSGGCGKVAVVAEPVEEAVEEAARAWLARPEVRARVAELRAASGGQTATEISDLDDRIRELEAQLDVPGTPVATIVQAIDRAKAKQEELLAAIAQSPRVAIPASRDDWPSDLQRRRALVELAVARVDVAPAMLPGLFDPERLEITPRWKLTPR